MNVLHYVIAALAAAPATGAILTLALRALKDPAVAAKYPKLAAAYRVLCVVFPDASDPSKVLADVAIVVRKFPPVLIVALTIGTMNTAWGCATVKAVQSDPIVQTVEQGVCADLVFAGLVFCPTPDQITALANVLRGALASKRDAQISVSFPDGTTASTTIPASQVSEYVYQLKAAQK